MLGRRRPDLVDRGVPSRPRHEAVGKAVKLVSSADVNCRTFPLADLQQIHAAFADDVYKALTLESVLSIHKTTSATASCTLTGVIGADVVSCTTGTAAFDTALRRHRQDRNGHRPGAERRGRRELRPGLLHRDDHGDDHAEDAHGDGDGEQQAVRRDDERDGELHADRRHRRRRGELQHRHRNVRHRARRHRQNRNGHRPGAERAGAANYLLASSTATTTADHCEVAHGNGDGEQQAVRWHDERDGELHADRRHRADVVSCSTGTAAFDTASVGTGKTVTVTGLTLSGAAAGNYTLASSTATTTATITPKDAHAR